MKLPINELQELEDDSYYYHELLDCEVYMGDRLIGVVSSVEDGYKRTMLRIKDNDNKEHLVLFMEQFVKEVNVKEKKIYLNDVEGLL